VGNGKSEQSTHSKLPHETDHGALYLLLILLAVLLLTAVRLKSTPGKDTAFEIGKIDFESRLTIRVCHPIRFTGRAKMSCEFTKSIYSRLFMLCSS
jgi:hypothetical protein